MYRLFLIPLLLVLGCSDMAEPALGGLMPMATTTMERLRDEIVGNRSALIAEDVVVEGYVISSDEDDNFYRTLVVDDGTAAVEVMMGLTPLHATYPMGLRVALCLRDCYAAYSYGVLQIGRRAEEYESYAVEYLGSREAADRVVRRGTEVVDIRAMRRAIKELSDADLGRFVEIGGLHLVASSSVDTHAGEQLEDALWGGYAMFKDEHGDSVAVYTRSYARYAERYIPSGEVTLRGLVQWGRYNGGKECYQLKMRYETDCTPY